MQVFEHNYYELNTLTFGVVKNAQKWDHDKKQEAQRPERSPERQILYTDFLSEGLIFVYQQPFIE